MEVKKGSQNVLTVWIDWLVVAVIVIAVLVAGESHADHIAGHFSAPLAITICGSSANPVDCAPIAGVGLGQAAPVVQLKNNDAGGGTIEIGTSTAYRGRLPAGWTENGSGQHPPATAGSPVTHYTRTEACTCGGGGGPGFSGDYTGAPNGGAYVGWSNACRAYCGGAVNTYTDQLVSVVGATVNYQACPNAGGSCTGLSSNFTVVASCPAGYTNSSGTCTLSNEALVMKPSDSTCGVVRTGNTIGMDPKDPDCSGVGSVGASLNVSGSGNSGAASGGGATLTVSVDAGTGNVTITGSKPSSGGTTTDVTVVATNSSGVVTGKSQIVTEGTGTLNNPAATVDPTQTVNNKIDETGTPTDGTISGPRAEADTAAAARTAAVDSVLTSRKVNSLGLSLGINWPSAACANPSFGVLGHTMVVDICSWAANVGAMTEFVFTCMVAFYLFVLGTGALKV